MTPSHEISLPLSTQDPYEVPALMPSSADKSIRSFEVDDFLVPTKKQDDWRFTPVERFTRFFDVFTPQDSIEVSGSFLEEESEGFTDGKSAVTYRQVGRDEGVCGVVSQPTDRASAVAWQSFTHAHVFDITKSIESTYVIKIHGSQLTQEAVHIFIHAHDGVHANIIVEHTGEAYLAQGVEVLTGENSDVSVTFIHEWSKKSQHVANHRLRVGKNAVLKHAIVTLSADVARIRVDQDFAGEQSEINMLGLYFVDPHEHIEHRTMLVHNQPDCRSRVVYKGALNGKNAHATWVGNALIKGNASGTDSYELNKNLVLTPGAIADSEPNLEIENGDIVGAGHASSVGRFDDEELFYLQSRGINEKEARKLVVRGFFAELIQQLDIPSVSEHLMNVIDRRLERVDNDSVEEME